MALPQERLYTVEDIDNLPEGERAELIDGQIYYMAPPSTNHQRILMDLAYLIKDYIKSKKGTCEVFPAPFAVYLEDASTNHLEPDISVICNPDLLQEKGCYGAPDWIIEITSPTSSNYDYITKTYKYEKAGIKEYWIVNPIKQTITVYDFNKSDFPPKNYSFKDKIKVGIYNNDLVIDFNELNF